jgi:hypothetical protein
MAYQSLIGMQSWLKLMLMQISMRENNCKEEEAQEYMRRRGSH